MTTISFQQHRSDQLGDFLNVLGKSPFLSISDQVSKHLLINFLPVTIMKAVWGGTLSSVSSQKYHVLLPQGQYN